MWMGKYNHQFTLGCVLKQSMTQIDAFVRATDARRSRRNDGAAALRAALERELVACQTFADRLGDDVQVLREARDILPAWATPALLTYFAAVGHAERAACLHDADASAGVVVGGGGGDVGGSGAAGGGAGIVGVGAASSSFVEAAKAQLRSSASTLDAQFMAALNALGPRDADRVRSVVARMLPLLSDHTELALLMHLEAAATADAAGAFARRAASEALRAGAAPGLGAEAARIILREALNEAVSKAACESHTAVSSYCRRSCFCCL